MYARHNQNHFSLAWFSLLNPANGNAMLSTLRYCLTSLMKLARMLPMMSEWHQSICYHWTIPCIVFDAHIRSLHKLRTNKARPLSLSECSIDSFLIEILSLSRCFSQASQGVYDCIEVQINSELLVISCSPAIRRGEWTEILAQQEMRWGQQTLWTQFRHCLLCWRQEPEVTELSDRDAPQHGPSLSHSTLVTPACSGLLLLSVSCWL